MIELEGLKFIIGYFLIAITVSVMVYIGIKNSNETIEYHSSEENKGEK